MEFVQSWIINIFINTIFCVISEFIITDGKFQKLMKSLLGVYFLINLLFPLKNFKFSKFDFDIYNESKTEISESKLEKRISKIAGEKIKKQICDFLHQNSVKEKNIIIHINKNSRVTCYIFLEKGVENEDIILKKLKNKFKIDFYLEN